MRWIAVVALLMLAGCEKSFDDRYAEAEKKVREQADSIDEELAAKASEAAMAPVIEASGAGTASPPPDGDLGSKTLELANPPSPLRRQGPR